MPRNASTFLALRYLRPKRSFISVITLISLGGVALGVLMMIVVKSVMLGFEADFRQILLGAEPHLLLSVEEDPAQPDWQSVLAAARDHPAATSASAFAGGVLLARNDERQTGFQIFGLDPANADAQLGKLSASLVQGSLDLTDDGALLNESSAHHLGVTVGDEITVYLSTAVNQAARQFKEALNETDADRKREMHQQITLDSRKLTVSGIFRQESDNFYAFTTLATGRDLFHLGDSVTGIAVELSSPYEVADIARALLPPSGWKSQTWLDGGEARLAAMRNEQVMMTIILWIIAVVAAFAVMNTTITVTTQKRKEIGVLTALGCRTGDIIRIFVLKAAIIGAAGVFLGLTLSLLVLWLRNDIRGVIAFATSSQVHAIEGVFLAEIPARVSLSNVLLASIGSFVLCLVAAFLPAWFAARVEPAVALRD